MGTHGRRRKVQRAGAEVCGQGKGALACLLRWPMSGCDGRLGRHQYGRVRLVEQRGERELRPGRGSRRRSESAVELESARSVHRCRGKRPRAIMYDMKALFPVGLRSDFPPCSPALAGSRARVQVVHGGVRRHAAATGHRPGIYAARVCQGNMAQCAGAYHASP